MIGTKDQHYSHRIYLSDTNFFFDLCQTRCHMSINSIQEAEFLKSIRMTRAHAVSDKAEFIRHLYLTILGRSPELSATHSNISIPEGESWDRMVYLVDVLMSDESRNGRNRDYGEFLKSFFRALGYAEASPILCELMKDIAPTADDFKTKASAIFSIIAMNTQRTFFGVGTEEIFNELDGALSLKKTANRLYAIEQQIQLMSTEIRHLTFQITEMRGSMNGEAGNQGRESYTNGLLLAILARIEMQDMK